MSCFSIMGGLLNENQMSSQAESSTTNLIYYSFPINTSIWDAIRQFTILMKIKPNFKTRVTFSYKPILLFTTFRFNFNYLFNSTVIFIWICINHNPYFISLNYIVLRFISVFWRSNSRGMAFRDWRKTLETKPRDRFGLLINLCRDTIGAVSVYPMEEDHEYLLILLSACWNRWISPCLFQEILWYNSSSWIRVRPRKVKSTSSNHGKWTISFNLSST